MMCCGLLDSSKSGKSKGKGKKDDGKAPSRHVVANLNDKDALLDVGPSGFDCEVTSQQQ